MLEGLRIQYSDEKNAWLMQERGVSFQNVLDCIIRDGVLDIVEHPNQQRYAGQFVMMIAIKGEVYAVPFVLDAEGVFLKTMYPSRKARKKYIAFLGEDTA